MPLFGQKSTTKPASRKEYMHLDQEAGKLQEKKRYPEAEAVYRQALDVARHIEPEDKDILQMATFNLGGVLFDEKRFADAEPLFQESCRFCEEGFGVDDLQGELRNREYLTNVLMELKKYSEAEDLLQKRLDSLKRQFGGTNVSSLIALGPMALAMQQQGKMAEADSCREQAIEIVNNDPNLKEADRTEVLDTLASLLRADATSYLEAEKAFHLRCLGLVEEQLDHGQIRHQGKV